MFEDNMEVLLALLLKYLVYEDARLDTDDEAEAGPLENTKAAIFEVLSLYVAKYTDSAVGELIPAFIETSWMLLTTVGPDSKNDILVSRALAFLTSVAAAREYAENFKDPDVLSQVVEKVILPNVTLRESDVEMFEDEPIEFTRRDLEGGDSETRRRAATDFLRQLSQHFQTEVTATVMRYIEHYLKEYGADPASKWKSKDTAVYLFCAIAAVGTVTSSSGVKTVNRGVNVIEFFQNNVAQDLLSKESHVLLQVDAIKYLYIFRSQISADQWQQAFPMLVQRLQSSNYIVHTYAAVTIDRVLSLSDNGQPTIPRDSFVTLGKNILQRLFTLMEKDPTPEKLQENEFLMRCVLRVIMTLKEQQFTEFTANHLINIMNVIRHNPSNPRFYYYLFESVGALIRYSPAIKSTNGASNGNGAGQTTNLEITLYPAFAEILQNDVQEFSPYVLQLFAALLEANPTAGLTDSYRGLIQPVLAPILWESKGNTPALVRLLSSLISRDPEYIVDNQLLESSLGIFQKLISSKVNETYAFDLLETVLGSIAPHAVQQYMTTIFQLILTRLSSSKTENLTQRFVRLHHFMSARADQGYGTDYLFRVLEGVQEGIFAQLYSSIVMPETPKLARPFDRKLAVISLARTLAVSEVFATKFAKGWGRTADALLQLMLNPPVPPQQEPILPEHDVEDLSFGVGFTQLNSCRRGQVDPYPQVQDLNGWVPRYLREEDTRLNGRIRGFVQERCNGEAQTAMQQYLQ